MGLERPASQIDLPHCILWLIRSLKHHTTLGQAAMGNVSQYGNGSLDVDSFVQPPHADLNALCFGRTNDMVAYLQQIIGVKYPFEKYDQKTAERFTFGGMENSSATILTDTALHPASEEPESSCDVLVAHELSPSGSATMSTMSDWSNAWINEGFATYYHQLWGEKDQGEASFEYDRYQAQQAYFAETKLYFRPIVDYVYTDALEQFDTSGHERPAQALHMLRQLSATRGSSKPSATTCSPTKIRTPIRINTLRRSASRSEPILRGSRTMVLSSGLPALRR